MMYVNRLFHQTDKQPRIMMALACLTWNGATKPFLWMIKGWK